MNLEQKQKGKGHPDKCDFAARRKDIGEVRNDTRDDALNEFITTPPKTNEDEERFENLGLPGFASFTKGLKHDAKGLVDPKSFDLLLEALENVA